MRERAPPGRVRVPSSPKMVPVGPPRDYSTHEQTILGIIGADPGMKRPSSMSERVHFLRTGLGVSSQDLMGDFRSAGLSRLERHTRRPGMVTPRIWGEGESSVRRIPI